MVFADYLDRWTYRKSYTKFYDVDLGQDYVRLPAYPVALDALGVPVVAVYNDGALAPSYSTAMDPAYFRAYPEEEFMGRVEFPVGITPGPRALKIVWTGGMANAAEQVAGLTGTTTPTPEKLTDAKAAFIDSEVKPGMVVAVTAPVANAGNYIVIAVNSNNALTVTPAWAAPSAGNTVYSIADTGFINLYPDIEQGLITQVMFHWKQRDKIDIQSISVSAASGSAGFITAKPMGLLPEVKEALNPYRREVL